MRIDMQSHEITDTLIYVGQIEGADMTIMEKSTDGVTGSFDFKKPITKNGVVKYLGITGTISPDAPTTPAK